MKKHDFSNTSSVICWCVISTCAGITAVFFAIQLRLILVDVLRDYGEGHTFWMSQQVTNLQIAYKQLDRSPFVIFPYPPLYLIVCKIVSLGTGNLLVAGRSISLVSTLGVAAILGILVFRVIPLAFPRLWRVTADSLTVAMVLTTSSVVGWASLMRVDMLGLALMYGGLAVYVLSGKKESAQYLAVMLFVLAAFTKQTLLSAPLACAAYGIFAHPRTTIRVFGFALLTGIGGLLICDMLTKGGFLQNIVSYNLNPFSWDVVIAQFLSHVRRNIALKIVLSAAALVTLYNRKAAARMGLKKFVYLKFNSLYARTILIGSVNTAFAGLLAVSIGKMGSIYNFFLALDLSLCLLTTLYLFRILVTSYTRLSRSLLGQMVFLAVVALLFMPSRWTISTVTDDFSRQLDEETRLIARIRATPGPVLSDNLLMLIKSGKKIQAEPATITFLTRAKGWDESPYLRLFERRYYSLIVTGPLESADRYSDAVIASIKKNYQATDTVGTYLIYCPRFPHARFIEPTLESKYERN